MPASRDTAAAPAGVSFEVDRFAWVDGRLEVSGRWYGIRGRRFLRPTLDVEVDGTPRRMLAVLEHKPWAADDGEEWVAAFEWSGDPAAVAVAELAVAPELAVVLPPPSGVPARKGRRAKAAGDRLEAGPPRAQALEAELAEARAETADLRKRMKAEQKAWQERVEQVEALRDEGAAATAAAEAERDQARAARDAAISERDELASARDAVAAERDAKAAERDAAVKDRDAAVAAREAALADAAKAAGERDKALREKAAVEHELTAALRARDKARHERNEWLTRARDAAAAAEAAAAEAARGAPPGRHEAAGREPAPREPGAARAQGEPLPAEREPPPARAHGEPPPAEREPPPARAERAASPPDPDGTPGAGAGPLPRHRRPARLAGRSRKAQIPPGGILLPPTGPGSHMRRSVLPAWAPRVLAPILLVVLVVLIALLIAWAF